LSGGGIFKAPVLRVEEEQGAGMGALLQGDEAWCLFLLLLPSSSLVRLLEAAAAAVVGVVVVVVAAVAMTTRVRVGDEVEMALDEFQFTPQHSTQNSKFIRDW
jgi:hypothetical protein